MSIAVSLLVKDEVGNLSRCLDSVRGLIDSIVIVDTGSTDDTIGIARSYGAAVCERDWVDFGHNRTELLEIARDAAGWLLLLDADMTVEHHPDLKAWLADDPDPSVDAWMVEVRESWGSYRLPLLIRGNRDWQYVGRTHEHLDVSGRKTRPLLGLAVHHHPNHGPEKHLRDLELLRRDYDAGVPRAVFYTAQALRALGHTDEAIDAYQRRAAMNSWEEEAWYAAYQAAKLSGDVDELLKVFERRPWRHEPLSAAARIVAQAGAENDVLFHEDVP